MIDDGSKYKHESRIFKFSPLAHARNARTRALLSPFCASLLLGRKYYLRGLYALCGFIYFNSFSFFLSFFCFFVFFCLQRPSPSPWLAVTIASVCVFEFPVPLWLGLSLLTFHHSASRQRHTLLSHSRTRHGQEASSTRFHCYSSSAYHLSFLLIHPSAIVQ